MEDGEDSRENVKQALKKRLFQFEQDWGTSLSELYNYK